MAFGSRKPDPFLDDLPPVTEVTEPATADDLEQLCQTVTDSLNCYIQAGDALAKIKSRELYLAEAESFEDFCEKRWGMTKRHADRLMAAASVAEMLRPIGLTPASEAVARPLAALADDRAEDVWKRCIKRSPQPTAALVQEIIKATDTKRKSRSKTGKPKSRVIKKTNAYRVVVEVFDTQLDIEGALQAALNQWRTNEKPAKMKMAA